MILFGFTQGSFRRCAFPRKQPLGCGWNIFDVREQVPREGEPETVGNCKDAVAKSLSKGVSVWQIGSHVPGVIGSVFAFGVLDERAAQIFSGSSVPGKDACVFGRDFEGARL